MKPIQAYISSEPTKPDGTGKSARAKKVAPSEADDGKFYAARRKIYPKLGRGWFRSLKWLVMLITLGIYYALPWIRWNRGPDLPDQAVLLDMPHNRFFFFFLEIWPQEFYFVTGLLVLSALALFAFNALVARAWCGYTCPQTVWTDLMIAVERFWQGDRNQRMRLDAAPWGPAKIFKKTMTHLTWLAIGLATGGAFVFYFRDAPTLAQELLTGTAPMIAYLFLGIFALTTYLLGGIAREQVCVYMCPWPRIQGAMIDRETLLVSYKQHRGEPRGSHKKGQTWEGRGDCVDCGACVAVCPAGIDIRNGPQLECIQCGLCIDACNDIMSKIGRPKNLISYATYAQQELAADATRAPLRLLRPRTLLYTGLFVLVSLIMLVAWMQRSMLEMNVLHDRSPPYVRLSSGDLRNGYTVKILNKLHEPRTFELVARGLPGARVTVVGIDATATPRIVVPTDDLREVRVLVTVPAAALGSLARPMTQFELAVRDTASGLETVRQVGFQKP